ncbi:TPA: toxin coregulated pilin subunit precursor TcpA, partial [Clostridium perfringens]|nr:toxin coregulated pilin subunit precursor TcpA [Clostridium perfringens]
LPEVKGRFLFKLGADTVQFQAFYFDDDKHFIPNKILKLRKDEIEDKKVGLDLNKEKLIDNDLMNSVNEKFEIKEVKSMDSNIENEDDSKFENFEEQNKTENLKSTINDDYE